MSPNTMDHSLFARPAQEVLSPRLVLRTPTVTDVDAHYRLLIDNVFQNLDPAVYLGHASEQAAGSDSSTLPSQGQYLADIGVMLEHNQWRKGCGLEALSAMIEYAQVELGCGLFRVETDLANEPFRSLMRAAALGSYKSRHRATYDEDLDVWVWKFGAADWAEARETTKATGKWLL